MNVYRSLNHIYAQVIDDGRENLVSASTVQAAKRASKRTGGNVASAKEMGKTIAQRAQGKRHEEGGF